VSRPRGFFDPMCVRFADSEAGCLAYFCKTPIAGTA
jgi:hypothetical protein